MDQHGSPPHSDAFRRVRRDAEIVSRGHACRGVLVLCDGWAFQYLPLANGRRQILNFVLPGEVLSPLAAVREQAEFSTKAMTDVQLREFRRADIQGKLRADPRVLLALTEVLADKLRETSELAAAIGQGSAEERIAYLILHLTRRIAARSVIRDERYRFPLRQVHIADALGLTPVHVCRVMRLLQNRRVVSLAEGVLEILDRRELERIGLWR